MSEDIDKINKVLEMGKTTLPDKYREQITSIINQSPNNWYSPTMFNPLGVSKQYAYRILEALYTTRIVEKRKLGHKVYYRYRKEERLGK